MLLIFYTRSDEEKSKQLSWTHALRDIVINCYIYHGRDDLLPKFTEEEEIKRVNITPRKVVKSAYLSIYSINNKIYQVNLFQGLLKAVSF